MLDELSPRVRQDVEEAVGRSERRFAFRVAAVLFGIGVLANTVYKIFKQYHSDESDIISPKEVDNDR